MITNPSDHVRVLAAGIAPKIDKDPVVGEVPGMIAPPLLREQPAVGTAATALAQPDAQHPFDDLFAHHGARVILQHGFVGSSVDRAEKVRIFAGRPEVVVVEEPAKIMNGRAQRLAPRSRLFGSEPVPPPVEYVLGSSRVQDPIGDSEMSLGDQHGKIGKIGSQRSRVAGVPTAPNLRLSSQPGRRRAAGIQEPGDAGSIRREIEAAR
ncbi:hypothetical protein [Microlunatus sp. GCM10028923]|uniref:hypothetical protein n=1 Tax=Microlunatus sp. GCM10028923 TaxID=3273400 RepID=UPI00366AEA9B